MLQETLVQTCTAYRPWDGSPSAFLSIFASPGGWGIVIVAVTAVVQTIRVWRLQRTLRSLNGASR